MTGLLSTALRLGGGRLVPVLTALALLAPAAGTARLTAGSSAGGDEHVVTGVLYRPAGVADHEAGVTRGVLRAALAHVDTYYRQQTGGVVELDVQEVVDVVGTASCADPRALFDDALGRAGAVRGPRRHLVVLLPADAERAGCAPAHATSGTGVSSGGDLWVTSAWAPGLAHQLSHHLGLEHGDALSCPSGDATGPGCRRTAFGDGYDVTGSGDPLGALGARTHEALGVLPVLGVASPGRTTEVLLAPRGSSPAALPGGSVPGLRVPDGRGGTYWLEHRWATGADAAAGAQHGPLGQGVRVLRADPLDPRGTVVLDPTPTPSATDVDRRVLPGTTWRSADGTVAVTVLGADGTGARVRVAVAAPAAEPVPGPAAGPAADPTPVPAPTPPGAPAAEPAPVAPTPSATEPSGADPTADPAAAPAGGPGEDPAADPAADPGEDPEPVPGVDVPAGPEPEPDPEAGERLTAWSTVGTVPVQGRYQVLGLLLLDGVTALKGVPVQLEVRSGSGWAPVKTVKTSASGQVAFTVTAGTARSAVRLVAGDGRATSRELAVPVHAPVLVAAPRYSAKPGAAQPDWTGSSLAHVDGSVVAEHRPLGSQGAWTTAPARSTGNGKAKGGFSLPLRLPKGSWEVRLVRPATAGLQQSTSKTVKVKVP